MNTVICDNSLTTQRIKEKVPQELIYKYISALGELGVRYVELDHKIAFRMWELPDNVKYILRMRSPVMMPLTDMFDFEYILMEPEAIDPDNLPDRPIMFELDGYSPKDKIALNMANQLMNNRISLVQFNTCFGLRCRFGNSELDLMQQQDVNRFVRGLKNMITVPISFCPHDNTRNALDFAMKAINARVDMITLSLGACDEYAALDEYLFRKMVLSHNDRELMEKICKAAFYHKIIFDTPKDLFMSLLKQIDTDIQLLCNVDTGVRIGAGISLDEKAMIGYMYKTALESFIEEEDIPEDYAEDIRAAIQKYDIMLHDTLNRPRKSILN